MYNFEILETMNVVSQTVIIDCPAAAVYGFFVDAQEHSEITGASASIDPRPGGLFSSCEGEIDGQFTQLLPGELIVMKWRANLEEWPKAEYAVLSLELFQSSDGTTVEMLMTDVPESCAEAVDQIFYEYFWQPLQREFAW